MLIMVDYMPEKELVCPKCGKSFDDEEEFEKHKKWHQEQEEKKK